MKKGFALLTFLLALFTACALADMVIEDEAFAGCTELTEVVIPEGTTSIGEYAFKDCTSLTSVTIPDSVTSIGEEAFSGCTSLTELTFSAASFEWMDMPDIAENAFSGLTSLKTVYLQWHVSEDFLDYFPEGTVFIGTRYCGTCGENLTWALDYQGVLTISGTGEMRMDDIDDGYPVYGWDMSDECFNGSMKNIVKELVLNNGLTNIGSGAFSSMRITSVTIPSSVTSIESGAFSGCRSLRTLTIPDSAVSISPYAFSGCGALTTINLSSDHPACTMIGDALLHKPDMQLMAILDASTLTSCSIPEGTKIVADAGWGEALTSVTIPNSVTSIAADAFSECTSLASVTIPDSVTSIGEYAFYHCASLTSVTLPASVTSIGTEAFSYCAKSLVFTVVSGSYAEQYCKDAGLPYTIAP